MVGSVVLFVLFSTCITVAALSDPVDCTLKENLPCLMHTVKDCNPIKLQTEFPDIYTKTDSNPGQAFSLNASLFYDYFFYNGKNETYPGVKISFTPPGDGSIHFLKGFQLSRTKSNKPGDVLCYIFDMSAANWSAAEDKNTVYDLTLHPILPLIQYDYELYTLPKPKPDYDKFMNVAVIAQAYKDLDDPADWYTNINIEIFHWYRAIMMTFERPPDKFGFTQFNIFLNKVNESISVENTKISNSVYTFRNVEPGTYIIWVQPVDPYKGDIVNCVCKQSSGGCGACSTTETKPIVLQDISMDTTSTKSTTSTPLFTKEVNPVEGSDKILAAVFGSLAGLLLVGILILVYCYYRCKPENYDLTDKPKDENHNENGGFDSEISRSEMSIGIYEKNNANKIQFKKKKKLFLLYEEDHKLHRLVVDRFATYLSVHCQCDVELVELHQDAPWVHQDLAQADHVVIINSEAAYKACMSYNTKKTPGKNPSMSSVNSIRNQFMKEGCYDHIIMVYFSYTDEKYILPDICTGYKYKLMKHFTDFLLHVHKLHRTEDLSKYDLPFDGNHNLRPIGFQLLESIDQATQYEAENSNWYIQSHGITRFISNVSDGSQLDSGCQEDFSPGITPVSNSIDPWTKSNYPESILNKMDSKSVITVTPSDLNFDNQYPEGMPKSTPKQRKPLMLSPVSFKTQYDQTEKQMFTPPTDCEFDFIPPDLSSNCDAMSSTQSKQLEGIVDQYTETLKDLGGWKGSKDQKEVNGGQGQYDKEADLAILDAHSREVMFNSAMEGDTISLGSIGAISM